MSWQEVTYWALRCDGDTTHGQCNAVVYDHPTRHGTPVGWTGAGDPQQLPTMWFGKPYEPHPDWLQDLGWLDTGNRILCPDHLAGLAFLAEAEMAGLPFDEEEQPHEQ